MLQSCLSYLKAKIANYQNFYYLIPKFIANLIYGYGKGHRGHNLMYEDFCKVEKDRVIVVDLLRWVSISLS